MALVLRLTSIPPGTKGGILGLTAGLGKSSTTVLYFDYMMRPNQQFVRAMLLGLMLIVGSVQAHASYFCSMMDTVIHDGCCCADSDIDDMAFADSQACCEKSVDLGIDTSSDQVQTSIKPIKFETDVDPPVTISSAVELAPQCLDSASISGVNHDVASYAGGSATYLITQRLRL
jgi:hypothetical protein